MSAISAAANALRVHLSHYTQETRLLRLCTQLGEDTLIIERIEGHEGLSQTWQFSLTVLCTDARLDLASMLGQPALLQILTSHSRTDLRPIHGHITACAYLSADGGFARYRLTLEPWLAFLRHRRDSYVWQGKSVLDILDHLLGRYRGQGALHPVWRFALGDASHYPPRDICTQFEESDHAFFTRLLAEEGLFYWFEHTGDPASPAFGSHTLVIGDHNGAFLPNRQHVIRYHRAAAVECDDNITVWHARRQIGTNVIAVGSWNDTTATFIATALPTCHDNGAVPQLTSTDCPGARRFARQEDSERAARHQLEALEARNKTYTGVSTVRTLEPATTFLLTGHPIHDPDRQQRGDQAATFAVINVQHQGRNNLTSDVHTLIDTLFANTMPFSGTSQTSPEEMMPEPDSSLYQNTFTAIRADIPWRPVTEDAHGVLLHPRPTVTGLHTAIVVGPPGQEIHTDRDHRIHIQMHWQRGSHSQSRLTHPHGDDNASGNLGTAIRVRVAEAVAGPNFGSSFLPRIGQEVMVDYLEGDIDRPIVTGSLYNGIGRQDASGNQNQQAAGPATGNAPAWFAGSTGFQAHNAILSGFKTQEIGHSQHGAGGYNQLVFDDSPSQSGLRLQTTHAQTQLNLGHLKRQHDNARHQSHGHGVELRTDAYGAIRAGQGLFLSADSRPEGDNAQMDAREAREQLQQAHALQTALSTRAERHHAFVGNTLDKERHTAPETNLERLNQSLAHTQTGTGTTEGGGAGTVPVFGRPDLIMSAPGGIAWLTPGDLHTVADVVTLTGGMDVSATTGRRFAAAARSGISLFSQGNAKATSKEQGDAGIRLHAAQGQVALQAHSGAMHAAADKDVTLSSTNSTIDVIAKKQVMLNAGGAYIKIGNGNIEIHAPGKVQFKAGMKVLEGPASQSWALPSLPKSALPFHPAQPVFSQQLDLSHLAHQDEPGIHLPGKAYRVLKKDGTFITAGTLTQDGLTDRIFANEAAPIRIVVETGDWQVEERHEEDEGDEGGDHSEGQTA